jgi:hypothetical protein
VTASAALGEAAQRIERGFGGYHPYCVSADQSAEGWPEPSDARDPETLAVLPALRELLPRGGLVRGSVVAVTEFGLLWLALAAGASAAGAWCAIAGVPEAGMVAAAGLGLDTERIRLVPDPGPAWPQVTASLLDGCELVLLRPPEPATAQVRRRLETVLRRRQGVLLVAGDWPGAQLRLRVARWRWTGLGDGHGLLRACQAEVVAEGRGAAGRPRTQWLLLPAPDGTVAAAEVPEAAALTGPAHRSFGKSALARNEHIHDRGKLAR